MQVNVCFLSNASERRFAASSAAAGELSVTKRNLDNVKQNSQPTISIQVRSTLHTLCFCRRCLRAFR